jgi:hypothetical protein
MVRGRTPPAEDAEDAEDVDEFSGVARKPWPRRRRTSAT